MYLIDVEKIAPGDILFTRSNSETSKFIREQTGSEYSHAILVVSFSSYIESDGLGVQAQNIQRILFECQEDAIALRLKKGLNPSELEAIINFARQKIGTEYSVSEAKKAINGKGKNKTNENRQFCTRFVAKAYENAGIKVVSNTDYCLPREFFESIFFAKIPNILRLAQKTEIDIALDENNPIAKQTEIHCEIFKEARKIFQKDIQTFEQLSKYVIEIPEYEPQITSFIKRSGYLEMWKYDLAENSWRYHVVEFKKKFFNNEEYLKSASHYFVEYEENERKRYEITFKTLCYGYSLRKQMYFKIMKKLYKTLIDLSIRREKVALMASKV